MRVAILINDYVVNVIEAEDDADLDDLAEALALGLDASLMPAGDAGPGWLVEDGVLIAPPAPSSPVPEKVSAAQARLALLGAGLLDDVETAVTSAERAVQIWFEYATEWRRDSAHIATIGAALDLTQGQIDDLFRAAAAIAG